MRRERRPRRCSITSTLSFFFLACSSLLLCSSAEPTDTITTNMVIHDGQIIVSKGKNFALGFFTPDGAEQNKRYVGIWYYGLPQDSTTVVWVANRESPIARSRGYIRIGKDGNLQVMDVWENTIWHTNVTNPVKPARAKLMDSGNLILTGENGVTLWQSFSDENRSIFLPAMGEMDKTKVLRSWTNEFTPAIQTSSSFSFELDKSQDGIYVIKTGSAIYWRSTSPNDFINSNGIPISVIISLLNVNDAIKKCNICTQFRVKKGVKNSCRIDPNCRRLVDNRNNTRLVMHPSGQIRFYDGSMLIWSAPSDNCSKYNVCGPNGICNNTVKADPQCNCLNGFKPISQEDWDSREYSAGCIKSTPCKLESEFFLVNVSGVENPDPEAIYGARTTKDCRTQCLNVRGCKCKAFSFDDEVKGQKVGMDNSPCQLWIDNDLKNLQGDRFQKGRGIYVRVARSNMGFPKQSQISTPKKSSSSSHSIVVITTAVVLSIAFSVVVCIIIMRRRMISRRKDAQHASDSKDPNRFGKDETGPEVPFFDFESIVAATEDFSKENKLGQGGFGPVYKGKLPGGQEIAVKRLSRISEQGLDEFKNEVLLIAKLQHRNLVRLLGYSVKGNEKILLYEYMPNKSLDSFIFGDQSQRSLLNWERRFEIIIGIARGLLYLHQDSRLRIIHRDLKASNILLDADMNPKISDFGLARIFGGNQNADNTNRVVGTYGYMSPEYALHGIFSTKSDVFSFGVMLLEIISGKKSTGSRFEQSFNLLGFAWELWKMDKVLDIIDNSLCESYNAKEVSKCINVGLLCVQEEANDRPSMSTVIFMLGCSETTPLPIPKEPASVTKKYYPSSSASSSTRPEMYAIDEISITEEQAR